MHLKGDPTSGNGNYGILHKIKEKTKQTNNTTIIQDNLATDGEVDILGMLRCQAHT